jgi:hypothetical protein
LCLLGRVRVAEAAHRSFDRFSKRRQLKEQREQKVAGLLTFFDAFSLSRSPRRYSQDRTMRYRPNISPIGLLEVAAELTRACLSARAGFF